MAAPFTGACACGAVRYRYAADPIMALHCHCRTCQRARGTHLSSHLMLPRAAGAITDLPTFEGLPEETMPPAAAG